MEETRFREIFKITENHAAEVAQTAQQHAQEVSDKVSHCRKELTDVLEKSIFSYEGRIKDMNERLAKYISELEDANENINLKAERIDVLEQAKAELEELSRGLAEQLASAM